MGNFLNNMLVKLFYGIEPLLKGLNHNLIKLCIILYIFKSMI